MCISFFTKCTCAFRFLRNAHVYFVFTKYTCEFLCLRNTNMNFVERFCFFFFSKSTKSILLVECLDFCIIRNAIFKIQYEYTIIVADLQIICAMYFACTWFLRNNVVFEECKNFEEYSSTLWVLPRSQKHFKERHSQWLHPVVVPKSVRKLQASVSDMLFYEKFFCSNLVFLFFLHTDKSDSAKSCHKWYILHSSTKHSLYVLRYLIAYTENFWKHYTCTKITNDEIKVICSILQAMTENYLQLSFTNKDKSWQCT